MGSEDQVLPGQDLVSLGGERSAQSVQGSMLQASLQRGVACGRGTLLAPERGLTGGNASDVFQASGSRPEGATLAPPAVLAGGAGPGSAAPCPPPGRPVESNTSGLVLCSAHY